MQPTTGPILSGTNLASTPTGVEPQGLTAPQDVDTASDRQPFRRVLNQEQGAADPDTASVAGQDQGGSDLPAAGNGLPVAEAESPDSAEGVAVAQVPDSANASGSTAVLMPSAVSDDGVLPILTDVVLAAGGSNLNAAEDAAGLSRAERRLTVGPGSRSAFTQPTGPQPATGPLPVLTTPAVTGTPIVGGDLPGRLGSGTELTASSIEQRLAAGQADRGTLARSSQSATTTLPTDLATGSLVEVDETPALTQRQLATTAAGRSDTLLDRALRPTGDANSTRAELQLPVSPGSDLPSKPIAAARADTLRGLRSAPVGAMTDLRSAPANGQRPGSDMLPIAAAPEVVEIGLSSADIVAARTATTPTAPATALTGAPSLAASQPVAQTAGVTTTSAPAQFTIDVPVLDPAWQTAVNERVVMMAGRGVQSAELRLSPAELGPLQVQLAVDERGVNLTINAAHPATRDALEGALPRLREMLSEQGMNLADANVSDQGVDARQEREADEPALRAGSSAGTDADELVADSGSAGPTRPIRDDAVVDLFA